MSEQIAHRKLKLLVDIVAIASNIYVYVVTPFWCHYDPNWTNHGPPNQPLPIQIKLFLINGPFFFFGTIWLVFRYGISFGRAHPFVLTMRFRLLLMAATLVIVLTFEVLWGVT